MLDNIKYIKIEEKDLLFGQDARTKEWYCKELRTKTVKEADKLMGESNRVCNKHNKNVVDANPKKITPPASTTNDSKVRM